MTVPAWAALAWPIVTAIINALFRFRSPDAWWAWAERNPRLAGVVRLASATGLDGAKALNALKQAAGKE
jgi:2-hydroxychromene-2-carboxylate isomerase